MTGRYLVTGGAGVIARELLELLSERGATVLSVDRLPLPTAPPPGVDHRQGDLAEIDLGPVVEFRPDAILHLAATFERSVESPEFWAQSWTDNVVATHRLVDAAARMPGLRSFVFASSYLVYRTDQYLFRAPPDHAVPLAEDGPLRPRNLCGAAKLYAEAELEFVATVRHAPFAIASARIYRVYGRGSRDVVSRWVRAALADEPVELYHPENRFDYVYSRDVADGLLRMADGRIAGSLNLATGRARAVADVLRAVEVATGRRLDVRTTDAGDEPWEASQADTRRLEVALGWLPPTRLEDGVTRLVAHEREAAGVA